MVMAVSVAWPCRHLRRAEAPARLNWVAIAAGFSMAIASGTVRAWRRARRQRRLPKAWRAIQRHVQEFNWLADSGLAFIESLVLYTLVIIFVKVV